MPLRLNGSTSGYSEIDAPAIAGDQVFTLPTTGGTLGLAFQVVNATLTSQASSSSSTFADTGLTASITPTSASSKVLVIVHHAGCYKSAGNTFLQIQLLRGSTTIAQIERAGGFNNTTTSNNHGTCSISYLDSPSTTSATTYKTQFASQAGVNGVTINQSDGSVNSISTITLIEVAA